MMHVGGCHDARGGYYEYRGGVQYRAGKNLHYRHFSRPLGHLMERYTCMRPTN